MSGSWRHRRPHVVLTGVGAWPRGVAPRGALPSSYTRALLAGRQQPPPGAGGGTRPRAQLATERSAWKGRWGEGGASLRGRTVRCAKSWVFSTTGSSVSSED